MPVRILPDTISFGERFSFRELYVGRGLHGPPVTGIGPGERGLVARFEDRAVGSVAPHYVFDAISHTYSVTARASVKPDISSRR